MADLTATKDRIDIIDNYTGENKSIILDKDTKAVSVSFGAGEAPIEMASSASVQPIVEQVVTEQLPALLEDALTDYAKKTDVGNGVISVYQGDSLAGSFTANQGTDSSISLTAGGGGSSISNCLVLATTAEYDISGWALASGNMQHSDYKYVQVGSATISTSSLTAEQKALVKAAITHNKYLVIGAANQVVNNEWDLYNMYPVFSIDSISETIDTNDTVTLSIKMYARSGSNGFSTTFNIGFLA